MAAKKGQIRDGRTSDLTLSWMLTTLGPEWQQWQEYAAEWMKEQPRGISDRQNALFRFFESYLFRCVPYASDVALFFNGFQGHCCSSEEFEVVVRKTVSDSVTISKTINYSCNFPSSKAFFSKTSNASPISAEALFTAFPTIFST